MRIGIPHYLAAVVATMMMPCASAAVPPIGFFQPLARYAVAQNGGEVAEIVAATTDGKTLIYTDSEREAIGFVDITDPAAPVGAGTLAVPGEPTSVAVTPDGRYALVVVHGQPDQLQVINLANRSVARVILLDGQPDSVAVSPNGRYAAVVIENERGGDTLPELPAGLLTVVSLHGEPAQWTTRNVALTGLAAPNRFPEDPEPEFVDINAFNIAAVTLQENNHVVLVSLPTATVLHHWPLGASTHAADLTDDGVISFTETLTAAREADAISWTPNGRLITANEGDLTGGSRDFTLFAAPSGKVLFEPGAAYEIAIANAGLYNDGRSDNRGCEPEGVEVARYGTRTFAFIGAERCAAVGVYELVGPQEIPRFVQVLPTGDRPEGLLAIAERGLFVSANEDDGTLDIFVGRPGTPPASLTP